MNEDRFIYGKLNNEIIKEEYKGGTTETSTTEVTPDNSILVNVNTELFPTQSQMITALDDKADLSSPNLIGTPTAPTASLDSSTNQIATTRFVKEAIADAALSVDNILSESSENPAQNKIIYSELNKKANTNSPIFTGTPEITTTPTAGDSSHKIADTAFVQTAIEDSKDEHPTIFVDLSQIVDWDFTEIKNQIDAILDQSDIPALVFYNNSDTPYIYENVPYIFDSSEGEDCFVAKVWNDYARGFADAACYGFFIDEEVYTIDFSPIQPTQIFLHTDMDGEEIYNALSETNFSFFNGGTTCYCEDSSMQYKLVGYEFDDELETPYGKYIFMSPTKQVELSLLQDEGEPIATWISTTFLQAIPLTYDNTYTAEDLSNAILLGTPCTSYDNIICDLASYTPDEDLGGPYGTYKFSSVDNSVVHVVTMIEGFDDVNEEDTTTWAYETTPVGGTAEVVNYDLADIIDIFDEGTSEDKSEFIQQISTEVATKTVYIKNYDETLVVPDTDIAIPTGQFVFNKSIVGENDTSYEWILLNYVSQEVCYIFSIMFSTFNDGTLYITVADLNDSTVLTGTPTAPTAAARTNTDQIATTAFVHNSYVIAGQKSGTTLGSCATAEGIDTTSSNDCTHAEGRKTVANNQYAHAEGNESVASGKYTHAEGNRTIAFGQNSHAEGYYTLASGESSHAEGRGYNSSITLTVTEEPAQYGYSISALAEPYLSVGYIVYWDGSLYVPHKVVAVDTTNKIITLDTVISDFPQGSSSATCILYAAGAFSENSHAEGRGTMASGNYSHAEGRGTTASGQCSHAEGDETLASGSNSHAEGYQSQATGTASHAEAASTASGNYSHAEGMSTASGVYAHAEGSGTASGNNSHAEGKGTESSRASQHVFGEYNALDSAGAASTRGTYVEIVGNGYSTNSRSNARTLDWSGNESLTGSITLGKGTADEVTLTAAQLKQLLALLN